MKISSVAFAVILSLALATPSVAEIYKYVDENGQTRWTDDLGQVPKAYRDAARQVESIETKPDAADASQADQAGSGSPETPPIDAAGKATSGQISRQKLESDKADLDALYQELQKEKSALDRLTQEASDSGAKADLNDQISAYNQKIEQYETRRNQFIEQVKAYNQEITE